MACILIIDDSHDMLVMLEMILEKRGGHEIIACHDGPEGLARALADRPDLAIVDVMMPGMSGYEVVERLREDSRTKDMGIFILTARGQPVDKAAALRVGADGHIAKPVNMDDLLVEVEGLLARKAGGIQISHHKAIVPFFSLKGGIGKTSLAVNLAILLQQIAPTVLVDLSPNSGHCAVMLGLKPEKHWGHYLERPGAGIASNLLTHRSGLKVLAAPVIPGKYGWFSDADLTQAFTQLQAVARIIVVDMPPVLSTAAELVFDQAYRIILLSGDDGPAIQTLRATLQALYPWRERVLVVRNAAHLGIHPPVAAVQKALRVRLVSDVPYDSAQAEAQRKGVPLVATKPQSSFTSALKRLAKATLAR